MIRRTGLAAFFLILTCLLLQLSYSIQALVLPLLWILFLMWGRRLRQRTFLLIAVIIGLTLTSAHLQTFGTRAYLHRCIAGLDDLCRSFTSHNKSVSDTITDMGFEDLVDQVHRNLGSDVRCALMDSTGDVIAWTSRIEPAVIDTSTVIRLMTAREQGFLSTNCRLDDRYLHVTLPLEARPVSDVPRNITEQIDAYSLVSVPWIVHADIIFFSIVIGFFLLLIEMSMSGRWRIVAVCALLFRIILRFAIPANGLFGPLPFASFIPFFDSAGDVFLSTGILFFLVASPGIQIRYAETKRIYSSLFSVLSVIIACILIERIFLWISDQMVADEFSYETLILNPGYVLLAISILLICITVNRLPALFRRSGWIDVVLASIAVMLFVSHHSHLGGLIILSVGLSRLHSIPTVSQVTRWTGMVLWGIVFLIPLWNFEYNNIKQRHVEDLSRQIADPGFPWFRLLVKETIKDAAIHEDLHDVWAQSALSRFPVMGEISRFDSAGIIQDRFAFGYSSSNPPVSSPVTVSSDNAVVRGVADNIIPPLSTVELRSKPGSDRSTISIKLLADMVAPVLSGITLLADGTRWPSDLQLIDRGLISDIEVGTFVMGWAGREHGDKEIYGFQREFADGPHLLTIKIKSYGYGSSILVLLAILGLVAIIAQLSLGIWQLWMTPSPRILFYRYRDRLIPFLLAIAAPPLIAILLLGPWAERRVLDEQTERRLRLRMDEVSSRFRTETIENALLVARHIDDAPLDSTFHWSGESVALFDSSGTCVRGDMIRAGILPPALVQSVYRTGRPLMIVPRENDVVAAVVPVGYESVVAVFQPLYRVLSRLSAALPDVSMAFWKDGKRATASVKPPCRKIEERISYSAPRSRTQTITGLTPELDPWLIRFVADDVRDNAISLGIRREVLGRSSKLESTIQIWGLGILLPVIVIIVFLSSWAAGFVSKPVSEMITRARRIEEDELDVDWPTPTGELGQLALALNNMTHRLIESRMDAEQRRMYLSAVLSQITSAVMVARQDGTIQLANPPAEKLLESSNFLGTGESASLLNGPLGDALSTVLVHGLSTTQTIVIDSEIHPRQWHVGVAPLKEKVSSTINAVIILEEITELTERERLLAWASFAREMAHEIKNPLTPMKLAAQHLRKAHREKRTDYDTVLMKATEMIERQTTRIEEIVREFSSFTKATGKEFSRIDLCSIISECTEDFRYAAPRDVTLTDDCLDKEVFIAGDREAVRKILTNLIDNAIRAVGSEGRIVVSVRTRGEMAVIECIDDGVGIPREIRSRIFEPGVSSRPGGTGLGLSICRSLVAAHGGRIEIIEPVSGGTGIRIEIPLDTSMII